MKRWVWVSAFTHEHEHAQDFFDEPKGFVAVAGGGALAAGMISDLGGAEEKASEMIARKIPSSGEAVPVIGLGTWQTFDVGAAGMG